MKRDWILRSSVFFLAFVISAVPLRGQSASTEPEPVKINVAAGVKNLRQPPDLRYPPDAQKLGIRGTVELELKVSPDGDVVSERVVSGASELLQATILAYKNVKYDPFLWNGKPYAALVRVIVGYGPDGAVMVKTDKNSMPIRQADGGLSTWESGAGGISVLSDTMGVDFGPYLQQIGDAIKKHWYELIPQEGKTTQGRVLIEFAILRNGRVSAMRLVGSSGHVPLDRAAWGGISASNPFPPLPEQFKGDYLALRFGFSYNPDRPVK